MARRIVLEIDQARARLPGRFVFLGKTVIYSAGRDHHVGLSQKGSLAEPPTRR